MKTLYEIIGTRKEGNRIRLFIKLAEIIQEGLDPSKIMTDMGGFLEKMKVDAVRQNQPESITVAMEEWERYKWNINDHIFVEVTPNE